MSNLIIYGSSSGKSGTTWNVLTQLTQKIPATVIDLSDYAFSYFDYTHKNQDDDFQVIMQHILQSENILFVTPVYWHAMSAQLKTFFDRLNDLTTLHKEQGRQLKGKRTFALVSGYQAKLPSGFEAPFKEISRYFNMKYQGCAYISTSTHNSNTRQELILAIESFFN